MRTLLSQIERFMERHDYEDAGFGLAVVNDSHLVRDLRAGRKPFRKTVRKIKDFMRKHNGRNTNAHR